MALLYPDDLNYFDSHEYLRIEGDVATIGVSAYAIDQLGDIVFLELPDVGSTIVIGESFGTVESVKAVEELYAPVTGEILERNEAVLEAPEILNSDPYEQGWLLKVQLAAKPDLSDSYDAAQYQALVEGN